MEVFMTSKLGDMPGRDKFSYGNVPGLLGGFDKAPFDELVLFAPMALIR